MSKFIGRRIVPKHDGVWDINKEYEELSIVLDKASGESYISRRPVPVGTAISDEIYWMQYSLYSAQIAEAVKEMEDTEARLIQYVDTAESNMNSRVNSAESLTNSNKAELNSRMDTLDKRLDANVSASTDKDKDYAAEVVDARVDEEGTKYGSVGSHKRKSRKMTCKPFSELVYKEMGWDTECRYKMLGYRISFEGETLYVFDLLVPEIFHEGQKRKNETDQKNAQETKPANTRKGFYPDDIAGTFGVPVEEHLKESEVKQMDGYVSVGMLTGKTVPDTGLD